ncbi:HlyD family secretion protein [Chitinimonas lacunae]|uniref:HlyD family secretion protein n=1 Tax=Chitinimonas lacunae TaxID=1963018 RepID=A0ABV8MN81_9NEIS
MILFREEAVRHQRDREVGESINIRSLPISLALTLTATLALMILLFLSLAEYSRKARADGVTLPSSGLVKVFALRDGRIGRVLVEEGQLVRAGEPLLEVDSERTAALEAGLLDELAKQHRGVRATLDRLNARSDAEIDKQAARERGLERELTQLRSQLALQERRLHLAQQKRDSMRTMLNNGFISENGFREYEEAVLAQEQQRQDLVRQLAGREAELTQARLELAQSRIDSADQRDRLLSTDSDLRQRALELEHRRHSILPAPISGRVTALQAVTGQPANLSVPLLAIIPENASLEAELFVPTRAIGFVRPGQRVRLQIAAFPYQRFGMQGGVVKTVSQTVLAPEELTGPIKVNEPVYRVKVGLDRQDVLAYGVRHPLKPGMAVGADIVLDRRPLWQWLFEPLYAVHGRVFGA